MNRPTPWIKATKSASNNDCVQLRRNGPAVEVRDSKNPSGPTLRLTPTQLTAWLNAARDGTFDDLARP